MKLDLSEVEKLKRELTQSQNKLKRESSLFVNKVGREITKTAIREAPVYSGETVKKIEGYPLGNNTFLVVSKDSTPERENFNLPVWLATSNEALSYIYSGNPRYMDSAGEEAVDNVEAEITKIIKRAFK